MLIGNVEIFDEWEKGYWDRFFFNDEDEEEDKDDYDCFDKVWKMNTAVEAESGHDEEGEDVSVK